MAPKKFAAEMAPDNIIDLTERMRVAFLDSDYITKSLDGPNKNNHSKPFLRTVEILKVEKLSPTTARSVVRFPVLREQLNPALGIHGGVTATIFDVVTTWLIDAIRTRNFWYLLGTSASLNINYLRPAFKGEILLVESEVRILPVDQKEPLPADNFQVVHCGKRLCLLRANMLREKDRALIATCQHQKVNIDPEVSKM